MWQLHFSFKFTARDTPQQNHLAEVAFATLCKRGLALMHAAHVPMSLLWHLSVKAFETATLLDGLVPVEVGGVSSSRYAHFYGHVPKYTSHLRTWGEAGTVKTKSKFSSKLSKQGTICMFVGYPSNHNGYCYEMWDPSTGGIHVTRDMLWLRWM